jgi:hypothetical protein
MLLHWIFGWKIRTTTPSPQPSNDKPVTASDVRAAIEKLKKLSVPTFTSYSGTIFPSSTGTVGSIWGVQIVDTTYKPDYIKEIEDEVKRKIK